MTSSDERRSTGTAPHIRRAVVGDAGAISQLLTELTRRYVLPDLSEAGGRFFLAELAPERMLERFESGFEFHVAETDRALAGVVAMSTPTHVYYLFVDTPFQRRGLARQLLFEATNPWRESPAPAPLTVNASRYATEAYRKMGFGATAGQQEKHGVAYYPMQIPGPEDFVFKPVRFAVHNAGTDR
ncbi:MULTISPECIES: GNAT family N-acetyltransferase [unclassified Wenzhouxiangella]|uniref:GNAT family N-acetyltransferase n=1 Tax=unclassified Wenzhouxiangella TaxID=2613841 RepID=UPI000E327497|nr:MULTISPECIES: GNAT family N-acetyltransferase [unclassified Wenzhouxiangella]RFF27458.1 GNAT family N-acetyltransferase [Wenzhouxiangella sp. 15181]RFP68885.1 GNAT family N-acetyltransferase [Wenzhouxiangella sp. 15190]